MPKFAIITPFLGRTKDRFHEYNEPLGLEEKFRLVSEIDGTTGVETIYPYEVADPVSTKALADKYGLAFAAINVNVKAEPEFRNGGLTSADKAVRANAVRFIKEAKDFAEKVGADKVTCCPLGDGYEFSFQSDYAVIWKRLRRDLRRGRRVQEEHPAVHRVQALGDPRHLLPQQRRPRRCC